jgi:hypothetical protein
MATTRIYNVGDGVHPGGALRLTYQSEEQVLEPDAILPAQFYNGRRGRSGLEPLKRLMMAVLVDAIGCYQRNLGAKAARKRREFKETECWLFEEKRDDLFSFEHVCDVLNTDPDRLREAVMQRQRARITGVAPRRMTRRRR